MTISVLIVDDHAIVRSGLKTMLEGSNITVVAEASDGPGGVQQTLAHRPDVVLLDIRMQKSDGLQTLEQIRNEAPETRIMILSTFDNPTYVARSIALGAKDYVLKGISRQELISRIQMVAADQPVVEGSLMSSVKAMMTENSSESLEFPLTNREMQVLRHIALGLSNREIGNSLSISIETVKEHVQNILRKIHAVDRTQAAVWAVKQGIVE